MRPYASIDAATKATTAFSKKKNITKLKLSSGNSWSSCIPFYAFRYSLRGMFMWFYCRHLLLLVRLSGKHFFHAYGPMMQRPELIGDQITQIDPSVHAGKKRRFKSKVWKEFIPSLNGETAVCKHCRNQLSAKSSGGTSHLSRHLNTCPDRPLTTTNQPYCSPSQALEELFRTTISNLCPFPIMSNAGFRHVLAGMYPSSSMISRIPTEEEFINMFQNEKLKLKETISSAPGGVFLSVGRWDLEVNTFICLTVHFIDREWKMHRKIIRCFCSQLGDDEPECYITILPDWRSFRHSSTLWVNYTNLNGVLKQTVEEFSLENKLLGIVLPETVEDTMIVNLEKILTGQNYLLAKCKLINMPCSVHVLHHLIYSVPNDVMRETSTRWFEYMTCSPLRKEKYQQIISRMCLHRPSFGSKRWYSTFYLMEAVLQFNKTFPNPIQMDSRSYPSKPSLESLQEAESFCLVVRPIYRAIRVLTSSRSAINSYFHALWSVRTVLQESSGNIRMERVLGGTDDMLKTFDKNWTKLYLWLSVAVVLDPRYKMRFLEYCFRKSYGNGAQTYISDVRGKIYELFFRYSCRPGQPSRNNDNDIEMNTHGSEQATYDDSLRELHAYLDGELCPPNDVNYLSRDTLSQDGHFDILKWWKASASMYPVLAAVALDVLAISGSVVSEESAFDETDERVYLFNRKLSHETVEAVICTQDSFQDSGTSNADCGSSGVPV